ncbi:MAG: protein kinase [Pirellulaceae bacterium]|nr:protein kinase [Pirellulaceae bacterium]
MNRELLELEQAFRESWRSFNPGGYAQYLDRIDAALRLELLARLLSAELEFAFQPPSVVRECLAGRLDYSPSMPIAHNHERSGSNVAGSADTLEGHRDSDKEADCEIDDDQRVKPCVPLFLVQFPELAGRNELLIRLIVLEYALRLRYDPCPPNPESYLPLCEQGGDQLIRLLELTENKLPQSRSASSPAEPLKHSDSTIKEASLSASITLDPLPLNLGCFLLVRLLGRGGMGYVHAAIDLRSTAQVAVKVMRRVDAWSIYRFIEEFRWLSQLSHPHLVKLYDAFCEGDIRYFSMELIEGKMVREWFRNFPVGLSSRWGELRRVLEQFASAVEYLHDHQVLHCDLKCSNMMITSGNRAVLLDLGLAIRAGQENRLVGTLQYMAPELIEGGSATYASDWYSFGVMIYEVLTDSFPPIEIDLSNSGVRGTKYSLDLEKVRYLLRDCPTDLMDLCIELLRADPSRRPRCSDVVQRLSGTKKARMRPAKQPLLCWGRENELATLNAATRTPGDGTFSGPTNASQTSIAPNLERQTLEGQKGEEQCASLVMLYGESGIGKTTLLQHWSRALPQQGKQLLLSVRCYRQDHTPVRLLNALVQELTLAAPKLPADIWEPALTKLAREICILFPQVQQLLPAGQASTVQRAESHAPPNETAHDVSLGSIVQWLLELSHQQRLILCVDDAQWADIESLRTLRRLLTHPARFCGTLVLVDESSTSRIRDLFRPSRAPERDEFALSNSAGSSSDGDSPFLTTQISLHALNQQTCQMLLEHWASNAQVSMKSSISQDIAERSSGNPFLLQEIFRTYTHHVANGDTTGTAWLTADSQSSVRRRFSMLSIAAENILQFLAVSDHSMSFHQLQMVSRILPQELQRTLSWLASQGWISSRGSETESGFEVAHENFRRAILQSIPADRIHRRHYRLSRILSCETPPPWARVARHYWAAEHFREASSCYLEAARQAMATGSIDEALEFLDRAEHPDAQRTPTEQQRVTRMKAACLARAGSSLAAAQLYDQLLDTHLRKPSTDAPAATGRIQTIAGYADESTIMLRCLAGEQRIRAGELEAGLSRLQLALQNLGIVRWRKTRFAQLSLALRTFRLGLTSPTHLAANTLDNASAAPFSEMERCLNRLVPPLTFLDSQLGPDLALRLARRAEKTGEPFDRSLALLRSGILLSFAGRKWRGRALHRLRIGRQLARMSRSDEARATGDFCMFVWHRFCGQFHSAARYGHASLKRYHNCHSSTQWEQQFLHWAMLGTYWYTNQLRELTRLTFQLRESAHHRSDPMSLFWMHVDTAHWADLVADQPSLARSSLVIASKAIANQSLQSPRFFLWLSRIYQSLYEGNPQQALEILEADWRQLGQAYLMRTNYYRWLALTARICCDLVSLQHQPANSAKLLKDAQRCARDMQRLEEPVFVCYGKAFALAIYAWSVSTECVSTSRRGGRGRTTSQPAAWETSIAQLHKLGHPLLALALQWHYSFYAPTQSEELRQQAETAFREQGCVRPDKLLNTILPLPTQFV